jgi:hypothetical protein
MLGLMLGACSATQQLREALPGTTPPSPLGGPMAGLQRLPYASMLLRAGARFEALLLLGHVADDGVQTWYGVDGLVLQLHEGQVIHSRGLPVDIFESHAAGAAAAGFVDCGGDIRAALADGLRYTRLRNEPTYFAELRESVGCSREAIVTPGYSGPALRIDEWVALLPGRRPQLRTRWLAADSGQLLRMEYGDHPWYPQIGIVMIKPVAPR